LRFARPAPLLRQALVGAGMLCIALAVRAGGGASSAAFLPAADLVYATTGTAQLGGFPLTLHARTTTHWRFTGEQYEASLHTDTVGFDQMSRGGIRRGGGLAPARYTEKRPFHEPESVDIDWPNARLRYGAAAAVPTPAEGAQDRLSLQFELGALYREHPERFGAGAVFAVQLIGPRAIDEWKYVSAGEETVQTGRGKLKAVHLSARRPVRDTEETMDLWLAADLHQVPVRIRMVDRNHALIDSVLQSVQFP
jgi:hypothetical protein